ncbi:uncharacterized protein A1O9_04619 [Exophiala aquamarina CBS 119918]|uniref:Uncharacterized protein n=1 Tax=Exophiala aquamarina CBS 119918 TaxID=1182545 RepID=A0A072PIV8_9EURO|nr:uncharacterized protein A1O9_04619 [Exophiala aquamarina CBS 119918]KEF59771.1 hypothetical protein A1O9_04619 [Exophiala aquamarina CBS 119918]
MDDQPIVSPDLASLAALATSLSAELNGLQLTCGHESTAMDIQAVSKELILLADELSSLDQALRTNADQYTSAFYEDLAEIVTHLRQIFDDVFDCAKAMRKSDTPDVNAVGWLHKKRHVHKLQKHLAANKTTLTVMRTVIRHGKDYGTQTSPGRLAESSPHTLLEDWSILESVFASRAAITDLQRAIGASLQHSSSSNSEPASDTPSFEPGAHGRKLSSTTGVEVPRIADVLPESRVPQAKKKEDDLARRFSKRGVRLAVHSSILDLNAHDVPNSLKRKWISHVHARDPSMAQPSNIPEVDSLPSLLARRSTTGEETSTTAPEFESKAKKRSLTLMSTPGAKALSKVIRRLSNTGLNNDNKSVESDSKLGWSYRLTKPFMKPELTTPDFQKDVESSALR